MASLRRRALRVLLTDGSSGAISPLGSISVLEFTGVQHAVEYLRYWKNDPLAMASLRDTLGRLRAGSLYRFSHDEVIDQLAARIAAGEILLGIEDPVFQPGPEAVAAATSAAAAAAPPAATRPVVSPADVPPAPLLPLLEEVQIEGAEVLPEVIQTLEQLELTMERIELANVSLDPAPSGIPPVNTELNRASESITETLDEL